VDSWLAVTGLQNEESEELRGRQREEEKDQRISNLAGVGKVSIPVQHQDLSEKLFRKSMAQ
jgi:hypothetical protein